MKLTVELFLSIAFIISYKRRREVGVLRTATLLFQGSSQMSAPPASHVSAIVLGRRVASVLRPNVIIGIRCASPKRFGQVTAGALIRGPRARYNRKPGGYNANKEALYRAAGDATQAVRLLPASPRNSGFFIKIVSSHIQPWRSCTHAHR